VYVAGGTGFLFSFDMATGQQVAKWKMTSFPATKHVYGGLQLDTTRHTLYAALGGICDTNPYQGQLLAFNTGTGAHNTFTVMASSQNGGGIWGWGGASLDANGNPFVATGNANPWGAGEANLYAERVIKLSAGNMAILGSNHPGDVSNGEDLDFGATPTLMNVPGCDSPRLAANSKNGHQYIYGRDSLNNGPIEDLTVTSIGQFGGFFQGLPAYDPATGTMFTTVPANGPAYQHGIMSRTFGQTSAGCRTHATWAQTAGPTSSPVSSPTLANGVVYYADGTGKAVLAFNAANGAPLWSSASGDFGGAVFSAPTVFNGRLYASSRGGTVHAFG
jgi:outer membrane protein assembly factor BamB